ncbi:MAG: response regulator [Chloroflexi bacterium]|nr:response regulator [Chloroflexota bacterium]
MTRILIVDSNLPFLMRLRKALEKQGHDVRAISRPRPALRELAQEEFEVAVVDLHMDWVEMPQFIQDMRARQPNLPIVLTGQYAEDPDQVPVLRAQGYLSKPYLAKELIPVVELAVEKGYKAADTINQMVSTFEFSDVPSFDVLMEMALNQSNASPVSNLDSDETIGELLSSLHDETVEEEILKRVSSKRGEDIVRIDELTDHVQDTRPSPALVIPDDEVSDNAQDVEIVDERAEALRAELEQNQAEIADDILDDILSEDTAGLGVTAALQLTNSDNAMQKLLTDADAWVNRTGKIKVHALPSWSLPISDEEADYQRQLLEDIHLTIDGTIVSDEFEEPPLTQRTQPITLPDIDLYLDEGDTPPLPMEPVTESDTPQYAMAALDYGEYFDEEYTPPLPMDAVDIEDYEESQDTPAFPMPAVEEPDEMPDMAEVLEEADIQEDIIDIPIPTLGEILDREEDELVSISIEDITTALGLDLGEEEIEEDTGFVDEAEPVQEKYEEHPAFETVEMSPDAEAVDELLEEVNLVGYAALQLVELSLESTARAIILSHNDRIVARTGELPNQTWDDILDRVQRAWERTGNPDMRLVYEDVDTLGNSLLCSLQTIEDLKLTLVFPAHTHIGTIRKQAALIRGALEKIPEHHLEHAVVEEDEEEPEAAVTQHSRPTDLRPPEGLRGHVQIGSVPEREAGTYMGYAVTWLLGNHDIDLTKPFAEAMIRWMSRVSDEHDWDILDAKIGKSWVNLHIGIPVRTFVGEVVETLMKETNDRLLEALGLNPEHDLPLWVEGYSVSTPGRLFDEEEIEAFAEFYKQETLY